MEDIRGALRGLVPFTQFKKREKHPWNNLLKVTLFHGCFSRFFRLYKYQPNRAFFTPQKGLNKLAK